VKTYKLYLESGPKRRTTMVHVLELLGCIANGPATEEAVEATPEAIRAYLTLMQRAGEKADPQEDFETEVAEHITEGKIFLGNGSPYIVFGPDLEPLGGEELEVLLNRFRTMREVLADWAETQEDLGAEPESGRTNEKILQHLATTPGAYLASAIGGAPGHSRIRTELERGLIMPAEALRREAALFIEQVNATTPQQRAAVVQRPKEIRTLRKGLRRALEHDWEHLRELSRRPGGPRW
jgi:hypothetical protein